MFKGFALLLISTTLAVGGLSGCGAAKDWVIEKSKEVAIRVVDSRIEKFNEKLAPKFAEIEGQIGTIDTDGSGEFSKEELNDAVKRQLAEVKDGLVAAVTEESDASVSERLKNYATGDEIKNLLYLVLAWILAQFGWTVGPKGIGGLRQFLERRKEKKEATETVDLS